MTVVRLPNGNGILTRLQRQQHHLQHLLVVQRAHRHLPVRRRRVQVRARLRLQQWHNMATGLNLIDSPVGRVMLVTSLPQTPTTYYGSYGINRDDWQGGEVVYMQGSATGQQKLYIQTATSGQTPTWKTQADQYATP